LGDHRVSAAGVLTIAATGFLGMLPFLTAALLYYYVLYRARLIPRWLSGWGIVGAVLGLVATVDSGYTQEFGFSTVNTVLNLPIALQEMVLAVWLLAKGFNPSSVDGGADSIRSSDAGRPQRTQPKCAQRYQANGSRQPWVPGRFRCIALWLADLVRVARVQALIASTTGIIPAIPFARAWEAVLCGASDDSGRVVTYRTVLIEHFNRKGLRLVCSDGYLFLRAWVGFDPDDATAEPPLQKMPDETLLIVDNDHRGLGLLKHVRKQLKKEWRFKSKEENPDTNPTLLLEGRAPDRDQGQLEGMAVPLFFIDFPEHETVALSTLDTGFPDWRKLIPNVSESTDVETVMLGTEQLGRIAKVGKLYAKSPARWHFNGPDSPVSVAVGPIVGLLTPASATAGDDASDLEDDEDDDQISLDELEDDNDE
jgi:hypothetical protein